VINALAAEAAAELVPEVDEIVELMGPSSAPHLLPLSASQPQT
jgi:hypothetical protein